MADQVWPISLPQSPLIDGYEEQTPNKKKRTEMSQGPAKTRRVVTDKPIPVRMKFVMEKEQVDTFESFYQDTLKGGSLKFDFKHPLDQQTKEFRFRDEPPQVEPICKDLFTVTTTMEILP